MARDYPSGGAATRRVVLTQLRRGGDDVLVRPDGHVAWRAPVFDSSTDLADVLAHALGARPTLKEKVS